MMKIIISCMTVIDLNSNVGQCQFYKWMSIILCETNGILCLCQSFVGINVFIIFKQCCACQCLTVPVCLSVQGVIKSL